MTVALDRALVPTEEQARQAARAGTAIDAVLETLGGRDVVELSTDADGSMERLVVPAAALQLFRDLLEHLAAGDAVQVLPIHAELTTQQAANLLNVSRPHLIKLTDEGALPYRRAGTHRRIRVRDLVDYKRRDDEYRKQVLDDLAREAEEQGLD